MTGGSQRAFLPACVFLAMLSCVSAPDRTLTAKEYHNLGNAWYEMGKYDKAEAAYSKSFELDPSLDAPALNLARMKTETKKTEEALAIVENLERDNPSNVRVMAVKAYILYKAGRLAEALSACDALLAIMPEDPDTRYNRSLILFAEDKRLEAREELLKLVSSRPEEKDFLFALARAEASFENWKEASIAASRALDAGLKTAQGHRLLAEALFRTAEFAAAIDSCDKGLEAFKNDPGLLYWKARLELTAVMDVKAGLETMKRSLDSGFGDKALWLELAGSVDPENKEAVTELLMDKKMIPLPGSEEKKDAETGSTRE